MYKRLRILHIALIIFMQLAFLASCMNSGYHLSFPEIDNLADDYPAQAKVFLSRADSNDNKGYYKLLAAKIDYQLSGITIKEDNIDDAIHIFQKENNKPFLARSLLQGCIDTQQLPGYRTSRQLSKESLQLCCEHERAGENGHARPALPSDP